MNTQYLEVLYDALRADIGLVVATEDPEALRQRLYAIRREHEAFTPLAFIISPMNGRDLWIVKKEPASEE